MKKTFNFLFVTTKAGFFLLAAILWSAVMYFVNNHYQITWEEIFVEADGMVFDLIVFGVVLTIYEAYREIKDKKERTLREKNEKIKRLNEEIDDYRGWDEKEAMYRIIGAIKRLSNIGLYNINLEGCYLIEAQLEKVNLTESIFDNAKLSKARLHDAILNKASFVNASMEQAYLINAQLKGANFRDATLSNALFTTSDLENAILRSANLEGAYFVGAKLNGADIRHAKWKGAIVSEDWLELLQQYQVIGYKEFCDTFNIIQKGEGYHIQVKKGRRYPLF